MPEPDLYFVTCRRPHSTTSEAGVCRPLVCIPLARARETCRDTAQQAYTCGPYTRDSTHPVQTPPHQFSRDIPHTAQHGKTVACPPTSCSCGDAKQDVFHMRFPSSGRQEHHLLVSPAPRQMQMQNAASPQVRIVRSSVRFDIDLSIRPTVGKHSRMLTTLLPLSDSHKHFAGFHAIRQPRVCCALPGKCR